MKKFKNLISIFMCLFIVNSVGLSQETVDQYNMRKKEMLKVEAKIAIYITKHINEGIPKEELNLFNKSLSNDEHVEGGHNHDLTEENKVQLLVEFKKQYWRIQFFKKYPTASSSYSTRVAAGSCANGDFETGTFAGYSAETSNNYRRGDCNLLVTPLPPLTTALSFTSTTMTTPMYGITNVGNDPNITTAALPMVWNGNHSIRINNSSNFNSSHSYRGEKLIKTVVLSQQNERIYFNYALVMHDPGTSHDNQKPTFIARVLDNSGNESDRVCSSAYTSDPFLLFGGTHAIWGDRLYKSWVCDNVQANGSIGDTVTLEFIMVDCGQSGHGGYAYIDDICDNCDSINPCNFQGSIELNPTDTCIGDTMQVCGTYNLAALNCSTSVADEIRLYIYQNGVQVGGVIATNSSPSGGTFCFTVNPSDFPVGASGGFDFYVEMDFDLGASGTTTQNDYHSNPGQNNDYIFGAQCCPEFDIFTCCDLIPSGARSSSSSTSPMMSPIFQSKLDAYKAAVKTMYPVKSAVNGDPCCDFCEYPGIAFPISIYGKDGILISDVTYTISWSNDASNNTPIGSVFPDSTVIVTVSGPDSCVWSDTFLLKCCENPGVTGICCDTIDFNVDIDSLCSFDPCKYPTVSFPIRVLRNGTVLTTTGYSFQWSTGSSSSAISVTQTQLPVWVIVTDLTTGCIDSGFYDIDCTPCIPVIPTNLNCNYTLGTQVLTWNAIPGMTYQLELTYNDPECCPSGSFPTQIIIILTTNSYTGPYAIDCFSWRVRSVCSDGSYSKWSSKRCACKPLCIPITPTNFGCLVSKSGIQTLNWNTTLGLTYQVEIIYNDPFCVVGGTGSTPVIFNVSGGSYTVNVSPITGCLSWRVRSVCSDGTVSKWSEKQCCCKHISSCVPVIPTNLSCTNILGNINLSWASVAGATYEIELNYNDPTCCHSSTPPTGIRYVLTTNSYSGPFAERCFSWKVRSICPDGTMSNWTSLICVCEPSGIEEEDSPTGKIVNPKGGTNGMYNNEMSIQTNPNPAKDFVTFRVTTKDAIKELGTIVFMSKTGEIVYTSSIKLNGSTKIDVTNLNAGSYIYKIISDNTFKSGKIIIIN